MPFLLLVLIPFAMASACFILRRDRVLVLVIALLCVVLLSGIGLAAPIDLPARVGSLSLMLGVVGQIVLLAMLAIAGSALVVWIQRLPGQSMAPAILAAIGFVHAGILLQDAAQATLCFMLAAGILVLPQLAGASPHAYEAALRYLLLMALGGALMFAGVSLVAGGAFVPGAATLVAALVLWTPLLPLHVALPDLAEQNGLPFSAIIMAVTQFGVLLIWLGILSGTGAIPLAQAGGRIVLLVLGLVTAAAVPLLTSGSARRAVILLGVASGGEIVAGLALGSVTGVRSAVAGIPGHALGLCLTGIAVTLLEDRPQTALPGSARGGLARVALVAGILTLIGAPPFAAWPSKALLFTEAATRGLPLLLVVSASHLSLVVAALRLLRLALVPPVTAAAGSHDVEAPVEHSLIGKRASGLTLRAAVLALAGLSILLGAYPAPVLERAARAAQSIPFAPEAGQLP